MENTSGERLRELMAELGMTQKAFGEKLYMIQQSISKYATGRQRVTDAFAQRIVEAFPDYNPLWITGKSNVKYSQKKLIYDAVNGLEKVVDILKQIDV